MFLAAEDPDSLFEVRGGILYTKKLSPQRQVSDLLSIVVPEKLRKKSLRPAMTKLVVWAPRRPEGSFLLARHG